MIRLESVSKIYHSRNGREKRVLDNVSAEFPSGRNVGVFGLNGAGKSSLIRLLSGAEKPDSGRIVRDRLISFPLGFASVFHPHLTGRQNVRFVARVYGLPTGEVEEYVESFAELGDYFDSMVGHYSSGMLSKLAFGTCLAVDFDVYLIDEITEVGDARFRRKALQAFRERAIRSDIIVVSHNVETIRSYCDMGAILHDGKLTFYDSVDQTISNFLKYL